MQRNPKLYIALTLIPLILFNKILAFFKDKNIDDFIYMIKILKHLILNNEYAEVGKLLKDYKLNIDAVESLLKIDKIKSSKNSLTPAQRKEITKYL